MADVRPDSSQGIGRRRAELDQQLARFGGDEATCGTNLHDLGVSPRFQGLGVGKQLLAALEDRARRLGCCKITLEVLEGNDVAQGLYRKLGYEGYSLDEDTGRAMFWQKKLAA